MPSFTFTAVAATLFATLASAAVLPTRQTTIWESPFSGALVAPSSSDIVPGIDFPFKYDTSNWCESSFSPFTVYLTEGLVSPEFGLVTENGTLLEGSYLHNFGTFIVSNFGLPNPGNPPPATLNLPLDVASDIKTQAYLSVVQEYDACPGHIAKEFSLVSEPLSVANLNK